MRERETERETERNSERKTEREKETYLLSGIDTQLWRLGKSKI